MATRMVPNKFPEPRWNEFPTYVYLLARSLERTVWEDPSWDIRVGGGTRFLPCAARLALFPPSANPPVSGPPFSVTGKPVARGRVMPKGGITRLLSRLGRAELTVALNATVLAQVSSQPRPAAAFEFSLPTAYPLERVVGMATWTGTRGREACLPHHGCLGDKS